jgi:hypothetical protein
LQSTGPLKLTVSGTIRGASTTAPLVTSDVLHTGQHLYLILRATERANAYVAYCDSARKLTVYPKQGALVVGPDRDTRVPETADFVVDQNLGLETIFVIASKEPLHVADPSLSRALARAATQSAKEPCAAELTMTTDESRRAAGLAPAESAAKAGGAAAPRTVSSGPVQTPSSAGAARSSSEPLRGAQLPEEQSLAKIPSVPKRYVPRGLIVDERAEAGVSVELDSSGIAILALTFKHEP